MNRRHFIKNLGLAASVPVLLNCFPLRAFASPLAQWAALSNSDKVLVFVQLHGGNDGLNTFVPLNQYSEYYNLRANIALPYTGNRKLITLDTRLPDAQQIGIHPDMLAFKQMYDEGSATVIQNVGYENINMSHFRGRDIYLMGGNYNDHFGSGWMGRFLEDEYTGYPANYPNTDMPDPPAIEFNNNATLALHRENGIPAGLCISNPDGFYNLVNSVGVNAPTEFPNNFYGDELKYLMEFEKKTGQFAERLQTVYNAGTNAKSITYPTTYTLNAPPQYSFNALSGQLKIIARLLSGGIKTRIFLVRIGGFDTHASQVETYDTSMGRHAALLYHLTTAMKAFYDDLKLQGLDKRVAAMTYSEFGRRVESNYGYGSDHGKAAPVMLFGTGLKGGVIGENPDLKNLDNGNLRYTNDYRKVYASVLTDWFGASESALVASKFGDHIANRFDLFGPAVSRNDLQQSQNANQISCYPNPATQNITVEIETEYSAKVQLAIYSIAGAEIFTLPAELSVGNLYQKQIDIQHITPGNYICKASINNKTSVVKFAKM